MAISRKTFFKGLALATVSLPVALRTILGTEQAQSQSGPNIITGKKYKWKMVTTWPPNFAILGEGCQQLADMIKEMSGGRLEITVYGGGELVPPLEAFDTVRSGAAQMGSGAAYYWSGKAPAAQFFASIPFGLNAQQLSAWLYAGGGLELWRELYADFNLVPFIGGHTGVQMGGWFNKEINTVDDFKGLRMRMPGISGKVLEKLGGTPVLLAGSEIFTGLERGVIDATEWIGPYHDYLMGFHEIADYYYYPGWHEPNTAFEFFVNKEAYEELPKDLQAIVAAATHYINGWTLASFEAKNAEYLEKIQALDKVEIRGFSKEILETARTASIEVMSDFAASDPFAKRVYESLNDFRSKAIAWSKLTEQSFYANIQELT